MHFYVINAGSQLRPNALTPDITPTQIPDGVTLTVVDAVYATRRPDIASRGAEMIARPWWIWTRQRAEPLAPKAVFVYVDEVAKSRDEVMEAVEEFTLTDRYYVGVARASGIINLAEILTQLVVTPDYYRGGVLPDRYALIAQRFVDWHVRAGTDRLQVAPTGSTPSWIYNVETPFIRGMIDRYGLYAPYGINDMPPQLMMLESALYRRRLYNLVRDRLANHYESLQR
jgi:hypothetical protein